MAYKYYSDFFTYFQSSLLYTNNQENRDSENHQTNPNVLAISHVLLIELLWLVRKTTLYETSVLAFILAFSWSTDTINSTHVLKTFE